ncbi:MAG: hypothetical protein IPJ85_16580 [Flavobacteriales bacterium]|nr:hypothetical protein [Flavobacteriales bacterium]
MKVVVTEPAWESYKQALLILAGYLTDRELKRWDTNSGITSTNWRNPRRGQYEPWLEYKAKVTADWSWASSRWSIALKDE